MWLPDSSILTPEAHGLVDYSDPVNWSHPLNRGLVAWYLALPGWMGGNTWFDLCRRNHGTLANMNPATAWQASSRPGGWGQVDFDSGSSQSVSISTMAVIQNQPEVTLSGWARKTASTIAGFGTPGNSSNDDRVQILWWTTGQVFFTIHNRFPDITVNPTPDWQHFAITLQGTAIIGYHNGQPVVSATTAISGTSEVLPVGIGTTGPSRFSTAQHDDVRWWNRALSATEVRSLYHLSRQHHPGLLNRVELPYYAPQAGGFIDNTSPILRHIMGAAL